MARLDFERWTEDEVAMWPGATVEFGERAKHREAVLTFGDTSRFVTYPSTPSDNGRALYNHVADIRRTLRDMGAERAPTPKSDRPARERNPGAALRQSIVGEPAPVMRDPWEALQALADAPLITAPGAYSGIPMDAYHGAVEICPGPSISSSGLKLFDRCPLKYWHQSPLNPNREPRASTRALDVGKAAHDVLGLGDEWPNAYYVLPQGFDARKTKEQKDWHDQRAAAVEARKTVLDYSDFHRVQRMAEALRAHEVAGALFSAGEAEVTLAWQDEETGVWLRARPDWLPHALRIIPDYKTCEDASPDAFQRSVDRYGYHCSAALYLEGIEKALPDRLEEQGLKSPQAFLFAAQEKEPPHVVQLYQLDEGARAWGAALNRRAIRRFADCLSSDRWPGYGRDVEVIGLPVWRNKELEKQAEAGLLEYAA